MPVTLSPHEASRRARLRPAGVVLILPSGILLPVGIASAEPLNQERGDELRLPARVRRGPRPCVQGGPMGANLRAQPQPSAAVDEASGGGEQAQPQLLVSQARAGPSRASIAIQAVSSRAMATSSHQIWFWSKPRSGRFRRLVSLAHRIRSSHRAWRRWRNSRSASCPVLASAAKQVTRCPLMSVNRSWPRSGGVPCGR
jgi:hypothetical protein